MTPSSEELRSWKEIAVYLGVSVKTAQVWERERGLPVHRVPGQRSIVYALPEELDAWRAAPHEDSSATIAEKITRENPVADSTSPRSVLLPGPQYSRWWLIAGCAALIVVACVAAVRSLRPSLASVRVESDALVALDDRGATLWRATFGYPLRPDAYVKGETTTVVADLDGDSSPEVLFIPVPGSMVQQPVPLVCLDAHGRERWRFTPGKTVTRNGIVYAPPYVARQFVVLDRQIIVTSHHHVYHPAQVAVLGTGGQLLREYWHPGHLNVIAGGMNSGRRVVFLAGVNNVAHAATIVALDPMTLGGAASHDQSPAFAGHGSAKEVCRVLFARSCLNQQDPYNVVINLATDGNDGIIADVREELDAANPASIQYHLTSDLRITAVSPSDVFLGKHSHQRKAGLLNHLWSEKEVNSLHHPLLRLATRP